MGHSGIIGCQPFIFPAAHNGIHKETPRIAFETRIGQLGIADVDDGLAQLLGGQLFCFRTLSDTHLGQFFPDVAIVELGLEPERKPIGDVRDKEMVAPVLFETALPITIAAFLVGEQMQVARGYLNRFHLHNKVFGLHPVGSDVLNGRCTNVTRYQAQVLGTIPPAAHRKVNDIVPSLTATASQQHMTVVGLACLGSHDSRMNHRTGEIFGEQQVAAAAQKQQGGILSAECRQHFDGLVDRREFQKPAAPCFNAERVVRL